MLIFYAILLLFYQFLFQKMRDTIKMNELDKGLDIAITGSVKEEALQSFYKQMEEWQISMPAFEPLVLDFGLEKFYETGLIEFWIANEIDAGYCGKYLFVFDGQHCPKHHHKEKHETFHIIRGNVELTMKDTVHALSPGDTVPVAPGIVHGFMGNGPALLLELSKPCIIDDNYFENHQIPIGGNYIPDKNE